MKQKNLTAGWQPGITQFSAPGIFITMYIRSSYKCSSNRKQVTRMLGTRQSPTVPPTSRCQRPLPHSVSLGVTHSLVVSWSELVLEMTWIFSQWTDEKKKINIQTSLDKFFKPVLLPQKLSQTLKNPTLVKYRLTKHLIKRWMSMIWTTLSPSSPYPLLVNQRLKGNKSFIITPLLLKWQNNDTNNFRS